MPTPVIIVHGGAGAIRKNSPTFITTETRTTEICEAGRKGWKVLQQQGSALDAVQAAVVYMEESPNFNAGKSLIWKICKVSLKLCIKIIG